MFLAETINFTWCSVTRKTVEHFYCFFISKPFLSGLLFLAMKSVIRKM